MVGSRRACRFALRFLCVQPEGYTLQWSAPIRLSEDYCTVRAKTPNPITINILYDQLS